MTKVELSEQAIEYLENRYLNKRIDEKIELLNYRLRDKGYQVDLVNEINELVRIRSENNAANWLSL